MGERRKRKSFWDMEEETKHLSGMSEHNSWTGKARHSSHGSGRYHEFSESRTTITQKSRDHSGWPSWESIEENPTAPINDSFKNIPEGKERGGGKRYYNNMSPGFDGIELRNHDRTHEYVQTHSQRHLGRGRSRSRSRTERRSWSRSLSRGRERERRRGWSRSRSRSRSRSDGYAKKYTRSRSPLGDYRHQSYGWSDTRGGPEKSSQLCRDFAAGGCKRASQCRFFHPCSISCRDGDPMEDDTMGSWRSRADHSRIQKHSYTRGFGFVSQNDVSDPYYGEDEQFIKRSRSAVPCKDFMKGNCRWGGTCRFSHHAVSDDSFGQKTRNSFFDKDIDRQPYKNRKPLCKYFAAGKCSKDNCRFSHEDPSLDNLERRRAEVTDSRSSHDKSNRWNGLAWDDVKDPSLDNLEHRRAEISDSRNSHDKSNWWNGPMGDDATRITAILKPTGVSETILGNTTSINDSVNGQNDDSGAHNLESENKIWGILEGTSASLNSEKQPLLPGESSGSYGRDTGTTESIAKENMTTNKQEHLMLCGSQMQNQDGITNVHGQNALQENQSFSIKALQQNFFLASNIQPQHGAVLEYNQANKFGSGVPAELEEIRYTTRPILFSGQSLNQNGGSIFTGNSLITNESEGQNILCPNPSNEYITDLNEPKTHTVGPLNVQTQMLNIQKAVQSPRLLETKVPQLLTNQHSDQGAMSPVNTAGQQIPPATDPVSLTRGFKNEHSQTYARIEDPSSGGMMPFFPNTSGRVPPVNTSTVQPNSGVISLDLLNSLGNGRYNIERSNLAQGREQNNQMQPNLSSPLPVVAMEVDRFNLKHPQSPRLRQDETVPISEPTGDIKATGEENEGGQENKNSETVDGHVKVEEGSSNKDEKGLRMFKNALVEFLKEILKPTWKEGRMSREVHKTVVKKVVDKVSSTIQVEHIPKTQDKVEQYLQISKPKITKLVQAYVERSLKADS